MQWMKVCSAAFVAAIIVAASYLPASAQQYDRAVKICNQKSDYSERIVHVYATHVDRDDWGRDLLVGNIPPGQCRTIDPGRSQGYCKLDWRIDLADGRWFRKTIDACAEDVLYLR